MKTNPKFIIDANDLDVFESQDDYKAGKALSDGYQWHRPLTPAENTVKLADISRRMDNMETQFIDSITPLVDKIVADIATRAGEAGPSASTEFEVELPQEYARTVLATIKTAYNFAKTGAADELKVGAPATDQEALTGMQQLTDFIVTKQQDDLKNLIRAELLKRVRTKQLADSDEEQEDVEQKPMSFKDMIAALLGTWFVDKLSATATSIVSKGVNNGRADVFDKVAKEDDRFQYSSILDIKLCKICRDLDGKVVDIKEYRRTQWKPPIHFHCRCLWILIRKVSKDYVLPDITGMPVVAGGKLGPLI